MMIDHDAWMRRAIEVAGRNPQFPFGTVLVDARTDQVVAEGVNGASFNPTWHGEIDAINRFAERSMRDAWRFLHLYTTAEPCCMCQGAILWAGIPRVYYGTSIQRLTELGWPQIGIFAEEVNRRAPFATCELVGGVLADQCDRLFAVASPMNNLGGRK